MTAPLDCQRHLFELPDDVAYFDAAAWSPLPRAVRAAGEAGVLSKARPWEHDRDDDTAWAERARAAAARMIGAAPSDIAVVGAVSHAIATAANNLALAPGSRILRVEHEFPSQSLIWDRIAAERGLMLDVVPRPDDGDWTAALLAAIARPGPPLALAALTPLHRSDGAVIDLDRLAPAVRASGAALVIDATQAVGAMQVDVARWQPDFLAFPTYKWVLGPYSVAFLYAAPHRQQGAPLEYTWINHPDRKPAAGAARYDRGERDDPAGMRMAATGLELVAGWNAAAVAARLRTLTDAIADGAQRLGIAVLPPPLRAPNIIGLRLPGGMPPGLIAHLKQDRVFASDRLGVLRVSPHVWTTDADIDRLLRALAGRLR
ncbi:MAG TPA: aminotransferase class V-fold PLP-dependent enzyme [Acidisphaera sp.]|nr:aminotransferase class V-fold PLP-dependent enzyme [Acidisphaera sp.]